MSHNCEEGAKKGNVYCEVGRLRDENAELKGMVAGLRGAVSEVFPYFEGEHHPDHPSVRVCIKALDDSANTAEDYKRSIEAGAWTWMVEYCRRERRDICGPDPSYIVGNAYKTGRHDGMGALMVFCEAKAKVLTPREKTNETN